jgi:hypothetical protein
VNFDALSDEAFLEVVNQDIRGTATEQVAKALRSPEVIDRWHDALVSSLRTLHARLGANQADQVALAAEYTGKGSKGRTQWLATKAELLNRRKGLIRVKNGVEDRLAEAKRIRSKYRAESHITKALSERNRALKELQTIRHAIEQHRAAVDGVEEPDGDADEVLWSLIDHQPSIS